VAPPAGSKDQQQPDRVCAAGDTNIRMACVLLIRAQVRTREIAGNLLDLCPASAQGQGRYFSCGSLLLTCLQNRGAQSPHLYIVEAAVSTMLQFEVRSTCPRCCSRRCPVIDGTHCRHEIPIVTVLAFAGSPAAPTK